MHDWIAVAVRRSDGAVVGQSAVLDEAGADDVARAFLRLWTADDAFVFVGAPDVRGYTDGDVVRADHGT